MSAAFNRLVVPAASISIAPVCRRLRDYHPFEWDTGVRQKFKGLVEPVYGVTKSEQICDLVNQIEEIAVVDLMSLVA